MTTIAEPEHVSPLAAALYPTMTRPCEHCDGYVAMSSDEMVEALTSAITQPYAEMLRAYSAPSGSSAAAMAATSDVFGLGQSAWRQSSPRGKQRRHHHDPHSHRYHGWHDHWHHEHHDHHGHGCECHGDWDHHHGDHHDHRECCGSWHGHDECHRRPCHHDDCHCRCCVIDADLLVNARLGEVRMVPIIISNDRRREREIELDLSTFRTKGGSASGIIAGVTPKKFTLDACEEREVVVGIVIGPDKDSKDDEKAVKAEQRLKMAEPIHKRFDDDSDDKIIDVDDCEVAYADLRIEGCQNRPIRLAVAVLPRDCHAHHVSCLCGCC